MLLGEGGGGTNSKTSKKRQKLMHHNLCFKNRVKKYNNFSKQDFFLNICEKAASKSSNEFISVNCLIFCVQVELFVYSERL